MDGFFERLAQLGNTLRALGAALLGVVIALLFMIGALEQGSVRWFLVFLFISIAVALVLIWPWLSDRARKNREQREWEQEQRATKKGWNEELASLYQQASKQYPTSREFVTAVAQHLEHSIKEQQLYQPSPELWKTILLAVKDLYEPFIPKTALTRPAQVRDEDTYRDEHLRLLGPATQAERFDAKQFGTQFHDAICAFLTALPLPPSHIHFVVPAKYVMDVQDAVKKMTWSLISLSSSHHEGARRAAELQKSKEKVYPQDWKGDPLQAISLYLPPCLQVLFNHPVAWGIPDETRFMHHHVMGRTGSGKTTYLSHWITRDIPKVIENNATLIVMDSVRLVRQLSQLKCFGPGESLHERVVIIDTDPHYLTALNPFKTPYAVPMLHYALSGGAGEDEQWSEALHWVLRAAAQVPDATLDTLYEIIKPQQKGYVFPFDAPLDPQTADYFAYSWKDVPATSRNALTRRIRGLALQPVIQKMFSGVREHQLDLASELDQGGKVFLISTQGLEPDDSRTMGRLFLFLIDLISRQRTNKEERELTPIFMYLDECQDYVRHDASFEQLLFKARGRRISITAAHHDMEQIDNPRTKVGLQQCAIQTQLEKRGLPAKTTIETDPTLSIPFTKLDLSEQAMPHADYHALRQRIFERYGPRPTTRSPLQDIPLVD